MKHKGFIDFWVGILMICAIVALAFLALKVSGLSVNSGLFGQGSYQINGEFSNIGGLKVRAPVRIAGVEIGVVSKIVLNPQTYQADVTMKIEKQISDLPIDTSARIATAGILGDSYVSLTPGYSEQMLKNGGSLRTTYSATSIESLISTFLGSGKANQTSLQDTAGTAVPQTQGATVTGGSAK